MVVQDAQGAKISDVCKAVGAAMDEYSLEAHVGVLVRGAREAEDTGDQGVKGHDHASPLRCGSCPQPQNSPIYYQSGTDPQLSRAIRSVNHSIF